MKNASTLSLILDTHLFIRLSGCLNFASKCIICPLERGFIMYIIKMNLKHIVPTCVQTTSPSSSWRAALSLFEVHPQRTQPFPGVFPRAPARAREVSLRRFDYRSEYYWAQAQNLLFPGLAFFPIYPPLVGKNSVMDKNVFKKKKKKRDMTSNSPVHRDRK